MATDKEYKAVIDALSGECERLHKENEELRAILKEPCKGQKMTREEAIKNLEMIGIAFVEPVTIEQRKLINDTFNIAIKALSKEPKSGKWIEQEGWDGDVYYECSMCGEAFCLIDGTPTDNMYNYCPNCGARMFEPQERSDKE